MKRRYETGPTTMTSQVCRVNSKVRICKDLWEYVKRGKLLEWNDRRVCGGDNHYGKPSLVV